MEENPELTECVKERDSAYETLNKDQAEYDKQLLALSAAFLGVALAFVKDVVPLKDAVHLLVFDCALAFLLLCVCVVLGSFQYSIHGHFRLAQYWERKKDWLESSGEDKDALAAELKGRLDWLERKEKRIKVANFTSGVLFVLGTILLIVFVVINMHHEANLPAGSTETSVKQAAPCAPSKPNQTDQNSGTVPTPAPPRANGTGVNLTQQQPAQATGGHK